MPKPPNSIDSVKITLTTTPQIRVYLERLVATGLYGKTPAEAADRLLAASIQGLLDTGRLRRAGAKRSKKRG